MDRGTNTDNAGALSVQEGGNHYKDLAIQPVEYIHRNNIPFIEGSVIKYVTRWRQKGGVEDIKKARHFLDLLLQLEGDTHEGWQAAKERYGRDDDAALDLLCIMFDGYEAGVDCYEDPEDQSGYVGRAFRLNDEDFHKIADLLNRRRPVSQSATKEQKHEQ